MSNQQNQINATCHFIYCVSQDNFLVWRKGSGDTVEIYNLHVRAEDRRKGFARRMVNELLNKLPVSVRTVYAITRASNLTAQQFYEEMRFRPIPLRDFYKDEPLADGRGYADAIMYVRDVGSQA